MEVVFWGVAGDSQTFIAISWFQQTKSALPKGRALFIMKTASGVEAVIRPDRNTV
jgi:hypothetical protein